MSRLGRPSGVEWAPVLALATMPMVTAILVLVGPEPQQPASSALIRPDYLKWTLDEPRDKGIFAAWVVVTLIAAWVALRLADRRRRGDDGGAQLALGALALAVVGALFIAVGLLYQFDPTALSPRVGPVELVIGAALAAAILAVCVRQPRWWPAMTVVALVIFVAVFVPVWIEVPSRLADPMSTGYTVSEMVAPGNGLVPLSTFFPQYSQLLGYPVAPLVGLFPEHSVGIALAWLQVLQFAAVAVAVAVVAWAWGRRLAWVAILLVPLLCLVAGPSGGYAFAYFGVNPLRTILPVVAISVACWALGTSPGSRGALSARGLVMGAVAGVAVLNNPDFGGPVLIAILGAAALVERGRRGVVHVAWILCGALVPFLVYDLVLRAAGHAPHWRGWLLYPQVFGTAGFMNVGMAAIGWHVAAATLFSAAVVTGTLLTRSSPTGGGGRRRRQGVGLVLVGGWSLLTLVYFAGRSLPPTLLGGYGLQIGWTAAMLSGLVVAAFRAGRLEWTPVRAAAAVSGTALLVAVLAGTALLPTAPFTRRPEQALTPPVQELAAALQSAPPRLRTALDRDRVGQILPLAPLVAGQTGVRSVLAFNNPDSIELSAVLTAWQCVALAPGDTEWVLAEPGLAERLREVPECDSALDLRGATALSGSVVAIPFRTDRRG